MKTWRQHTFARAHYRSYSFSISVDRLAFTADLTLGRHTWTLEVEW